MPEGNGPADWTALHVDVELGEGSWSPFADALIDGKVERVGVLPEGTENGKPAVGLLIRLPDGQAVGAWTTYDLFMTAARALRARYGPAGEAPRADPRDPTKPESRG